MHFLTKSVYYLIVLVSFVLVVISMMSLTYNNALWWMKAIDFPRTQYLGAAVACLFLLLFWVKKWSFWAMFLASGLLATIVIQAWFVYPYTTLATPEVSSLPSAEVRPEARVRLMIANVYMYNRADSQLLRVVEETDPDMLLLLEPDTWWVDHISSLRQRYRYHHERPLDDTYGMALYSRYPLNNFTTLFLQHDNVPSFHCDVSLPSGRSFRFHGVHPVPPILSEHPDNAGRQEHELIAVGKLVKKKQLPTVVAGDFNDVAWSNTSRLFQVEGALKDTRVGRGLYNSYDATSYIMRWPLDHVYVSEAFRVLDFRRLEKIGSDHFPIYVELALPE